MKKEKMREFSKKGLLYFLAVMLVFTVASRVLDSLTVAKVTIGYVNKGPVVHEVTGTGVIGAREELYITLEQGLFLIDVACGAGQAVEQGDPLFFYLLEDLEEKKKGLEREYEKLSLSLMQEELGQTPIPKMTQEELALQRLAVAVRELERGTKKVEKAREDYRGALEDLNTDYDKKLEQTEEQLSEAARLDYLSAKNSYRQTENEMEEALEPLREEADEAGEAYDALVNAGAPTEEIAEAKKRMEEAGKALEKAQKKWNRDLSYAETAMEIKEEAYDRVRYGGSGLEAVEQEYKASKKQLESGLEAAEETYQALLDSVEAANLELENARKSDGYDQLAAQRESESSQLRQRMIQIDMEEKQEEIDSVTKLLENQGQVLAPASGTVLAVKAEAGRRTTGEEQIRLGLGQPAFEGSVDKKMGELLTVGQEISVTLQGSQAQIKGTITGLYEMNEDTMQVKAHLENGTLGKSASMKAQIQSGNYMEVIPIEALREDSKGYYCLVVGEQNTFLGTQTVAVRRDLTVIEKSARTAAVEGAVSYEDKLIIGSSKGISENDRIRVIE